MIHLLITNHALLHPLSPISGLRRSIGSIRLDRLASAVQEQVQEWRS